MIQISVTEHDGIDTRSSEPRLSPVAQAKLLVTLEEPTVDEQPRALRLDQLARARHGLGRAQEGQRKLR